MIWPQNRGNNSNTWSQISNPLKSTEGGVIGYTAKEINFESKFWGGLEYNSGPQSLLDFILYLLLLHIDTDTGKYNYNFSGTDGDI